MYNPNTDRTANVFDGVTVRSITTQQFGRTQLKMSDPHHLNRFIDAQESD